MGDSSWKSGILLVVSGFQSVEAKPVNIKEGDMGGKNFIGQERDFCCFSSSSSF